MGCRKTIISLDCHSFLCCLPFTRFIFDDVEEGELKPFDERMAYLAIQLFYHINPHFTPILINCDAGISRSAAFASIYHDYILCSRDPNPFEVPPYHPNAHVKRVFKKQLYGV